MPSAILPIIIMTNAVLLRAAIKLNIVSIIEARSFQLVRMLDSIATFIIMTLGITAVNMSIKKTALSIMILIVYAECHKADCQLC